MISESAKPRCETATEKLKVQIISDDSNGSDGQFAKAVNSIKPDKHAPITSVSID